MPCVPYNAKQGWKDEEDRNCRVDEFRKRAVPIYRWPRRTHLAVLKKEPAHEFVKNEAIGPSITPLPLTASRADQIFPTLTTAQVDRIAAHGTYACYARR
jgi:hypothetical protein